MAAFTVPAGTSKRGPSNVVPFSLICANWLVSAVPSSYLGCRDQRREFGVARDVDKQIIGHPATGRIVGIGRWNSYREQIGFGVGYRSRERALRAPITVEGVAIEADVLRQSLVD